MVRESHRARVIEAIRGSSVALDDDQLAHRLGIEPRQTVNQICRALAAVGMIRRLPGSDRKIVNQWIEPSSGALIGVAPRALAAPDGVKTNSIKTEPKPGQLRSGNSDIQRGAERTMLDLIGNRLGLRLDPTRLPLPSGVWIEVDGADEKRSVLVECWAHQGPAKSAQKNKVLADALRLTWTARTLYPAPRLLLCFGDQAAARAFLPSSRSWAARALQDLSIEVEVVELPTALRQSVIDAQQRQYR